MKRLHAWAATASLLALISGCRESTQEGKSGSWEVSAGEISDGPRFSGPDFEFEVGTPETCKKGGALAPPSGQTRISVPVRVVGVSPRNIPVSPLEFTLEDSSGHRFRPTLAGCRDTFAPTELAEGRKLEGHVAFDVPNPAAKFEMLFDPFVIGRKPLIARARVPVLKKER